MHKGNLMIGGIFKVLAVVAISVGLSGCFTIQHNMKIDNEDKKTEQKNGYENKNLENANQKVQIDKQYMQIANENSTYVTTQNTLEGTINSLATQLMSNKKLLNSKHVLITSFVRLDNFKKTSEFGRVVSESLINEMSNRGFNIIEYRGQLAVTLNSEGEYFITRKPHEMKGKVLNSYVVVGTYSRQVGGIILNARVIDNITGKIITSARATYQHNLSDDCSMFNDCKPARTIKIIEEK